MATPGPWRSPHLQQHEPLPVVERAFVGRVYGASGIGRGLRQRPKAAHATMALLRGLKLQVALEVELPGTDRLIDVAADRIDLARPGIDRRDHLAMGAPDRACVGAAAKLRSDALADRSVAQAGERRLALMADQ